MTEPLRPPPRKNPQKRTVSPTRPPEMRSRASLGLSAAAAEGLEEEGVGPGNEGDATVAVGGATVGATVEAEAVTECVVSEVG